MSTSNNTEWISLKWAYPRSTQRSFERDLEYIEDASEVKWSNGKNPTDISFTSIDNNHLIFNIEKGWLGHTADILLIKNSKETVSTYEFVKEINLGLEAINVLDTKRTFLEVWSIPLEEVVFDTICKHCGAPALAMVFSVVCSRGCK